MMVRHEGACFLAPLVVNMAEPTKIYNNLFMLLAESHRTCFDCCCVGI